MPFAVDDFYTRDPGSGLTVPGVDGQPTVLENDSDPNGLPLNAKLVSQPLAGEVVLDESGGFVYTPADPAATAADTFEYMANNGTVDSNVATVTISVDSSPSVGNQAPSFTKGPDVNVQEDSGLQIFANWATNISAGPGESDQHVTLSSSPTTATRDCSTFCRRSIPRARLTFSPAADANGTATITLKITDDGGTADGGINESPTQTFTINVTPVNDAPAISAPGGQVVTEDSSRTFSGASAISVSDIDAEGGLLTVTLAASHGTLTLGSTSSLTVSGNGTGTVVATGTVAALNAGLNGTTYVPTAGLQRQ